VRLLGPGEVRVDGSLQHLEHLTLAVLIRLVIADGKAVRWDEIYRDVWQQAPAGSSANLVQTRIRTLRRLLDPASPHAGSTMLRLVPGKPSGYVLSLGRDQVDLYQFADLLSEAGVADGDWATDLYNKALALWRDRPLLDVADHAFAEPTIMALNRSRDEAERRLAALHFEAGRTDEAIALLMPLLTRHPQDQELAGLMAACRSARRPPHPAEIPRPDGGRPPAEPDIEATGTAASWTRADSLARTVAQQWTDDATAHELRTSTPLVMSWRPADPSLMEVNPSHLAGTGSLHAPLRAAAGRLVVLGAPGAGKTMLLIALVEELLAARRPGDPVPVLMTLTDWDPPRQRFHDWLAEHLVRDYPSLGTRAPAEVGAGRWANVLMVDGLILPVLDGLDELPPPVQQRAIHEIGLGLAPGHGVVLASRTDGYRAAVHAGDGLPVRLSGAAGIELSDVNPQRAADYLRRDNEERWTRVVADLGTDHPIGQALLTPLMVALIRTGFGPTTGRDPAELCDATVYPTATAIRETLVDEYLVVAYRRPRPGRPRKWSEEQTRHALQFLAWHLQQRSTTELAWWRLRDATPSPLVGGVLATVCGIGVAIVVSLAGPLTAWLGGEPHKSVGLGTGLGILAGLALAFMVGGLRDRQPAYGLAAGLTGALAGGFLAGVANLLGIGKADWPTGGLAGALAAGAAVAPVAGVAGGLAGGLVGGLVAGLASSVGSGLAAGLVDGAGVGLATGLTIGRVGQRAPTTTPTWQRTGLVGGTALGLATGMATGLVAGPGLGVVAAVVVGLAAGWTSGLSSVGAEVAELPSPRASLRHAARAFARYSTAAAVTGGSFAMLADGLDAVRFNGFAVQLKVIAANGTALGLTVAIVAGLVFGGMHSAWAAFAISRTWLAARGHLPRRLMAFLADAHDRGLLRQLGSIYQFRHLELQRCLAQQYEARVHATHSRSSWRSRAGDPYRSTAPAEHDHGRAG
jgi:hypothetical protein